MKTIFLLFCLVALHGYAKGWVVYDEKEALEEVQNGANKFALNLYKTALKKERGNFIASPFSAYMALAMASYGAQGRTLEELQEVLHLPKGTQSADIGTKLSLKAIIRKFEMLRPVFLRVGNKIFARSDVSLNPQYQNILERTFLSPMEKVNFNNPEGAAQQINSWSSQFTNQKIKKIVNPSELNDKLALMLLNAVYFYGEWKVPFDTELTLPRPFHVSEKLTKDVPMMLRHGNFEYGVLSHMNATFVVLPYQDGGEQADATYMYFILPNRGSSLAQLQEKIDFLTMHDLHSTETYYYLDLYVPKFQITSTFDLNDQLTQMGVKNAFSDAANFDGMTSDQQKLSISRVVQKAFIAVDERATEAAGTTSVDLEPKMLLEYWLDRPFLVVLATKDVILFTGKVVDPTS